jgi:bla regulator protein blaR1
MTHRLILVTLLAAMGTAGCALGQTATPKAPQFEVASIKPSNTEDRRPLITFPNGSQLTIRNFTARRLIQTAYRIKDFQISGGPAWVGSDFYDVSAKSEAAVQQDEMMPLLQVLLASRFQLVVRRETKEMPVYALVVAKNGPKLKPADASAPRMIRIRRGLLTAAQGSTAIVADQLQNFLGRTVIDRTGLTGNYDVKLEWVPDEYQVAMLSAMGVPEGFGAPPPDWHGPSLFTALEEQLGLKLESQKGPVEIFTIERIERPSAN